MAINIAKSAKMTEETARKTLYITTVRFHGMQQRLFLEGEDSALGKQQYRSAIEGLSAVGDSAESWTEFLSRAIKHFERFGFLWTAQ